jgi:hypothetical protein
VYAAGALALLAGRQLMYELAEMSGVTLLAVLTFLITTGGFFLALLWGSPAQASRWGSWLLLVYGFLLMVWIGNAIFDRIDQARRVKRKPPS